MDSPNAKSPCQYRVAFVFCTLLGFAFMAQWPTLMTILGVGHGGYWFLDINTLLASNDAVSLGLDPYQPTPLDVLHDVHSYSAWWLQLRHLGLGRADRIWLGTAINLGFFATVFWRLRPSTYGEFLPLWLLVWSPPVILGFNRANPDLLIFALLTPVSVCWHRPHWAPRVLGMGLIALAIGMKYYPVAACALVFLTARSRRDLMVQIGWWCVIGGLLVFSLWDDLLRSPTHPARMTGYFTFGASTLATNLGNHAVLIRGLEIGLAALALAYGWTRPVLRPRSDQAVPVAEFLLGATILLLCYFITINYAYRLVFVLLLVPWLLQGAQSTVPEERRYARILAGLTLATMWLDGLAMMTARQLQNHLSPETMGNVHRSFVILIDALQVGWILALVVGVGSLIRQQWLRWQVTP